MAALASSDILVKYSVTTGSAGNSTAGAMASSWGKYISTTQVPDNTLNNLFPDFTAAENAGLTAKYVCIFLHNSNGSSNPWNTVQVYLTQPSGLALAVSVDTTGVTAKGSSSAQAKSIPRRSRWGCRMSRCSPLVASSRPAWVGSPRSSVRAARRRS